MAAVMTDQIDVPLLDSLLPISDSSKITTNILLDYLTILTQCADLPLDATDCHPAT